MAQKADWEQMFKRADFDGDGFVTTAELAKALKLFGYPGNETKIKNLILKADRDGDKKLSVDEFNQSMEKAPTEVHLAAMLNSLFVQCDLDKDVEVTPQELREVFKKRGKTITDEQMTTIMAIADTDKSGSMNVQEFITAVANKVLQ